MGTKINLKILTAATQHFLPAETPFLFALREKMQNERPYCGLEILHNTPLTLITLLKIESLILGGAEVTLGSLRSIKPHQDALELVLQAGISLLPEASNKEFDINLDCCAELAFRRPPRLGAIELTQSGDVIYRKSSLSYPVISVDNSKLKYLETISTGESFVRAILALTNTRINGKKFIVFGYGKVGKGVVKALRAYTEQIVIVDINETALAMVEQIGLPGISILNKAAIKKEMQDAFCVVTATGVAGMISQYFNRADLGDAYLANLGVDDEFGDKFSAQDVLFAKQPLNFSLDRPTALRYLDPVFYAHNIAIDLLLSKEIEKCYHPFPNNLASTILEKWLLLHPEKLGEILEP